MSRKKKEKIYISLPIAGQEDTVYERNNVACKYAIEKGYEAVSPIDGNHISEDDLQTHTQIERTAYYMGRDIEQVILCDAILMCPGWENSKGCKVEKFTAETYSKKILYME